MFQCYVLSSEDIEFINGIAKRAGKLAMAMRSGVKIAKKASAYDLVTDADLACSKLIVGELKSRFPDDEIISEEDPSSIGHSYMLPSGEAARTWVIDPIDGTENYVANDGKYSVMIGLLINNQPAYGWVCNPCTDTLYVTCPGQRARKFVGSQVTDLPIECPSLNSTRVKLLMGNRDRQQHNWVETIPGIEFVYSGSVGLRVAMIIEGSADVYVHLSGKLKIWDTVAPVAMALSAGLDIGSFEADELIYLPATNLTHEFPVAIGKPGTLCWMRRNLRIPSLSLS